MTITVGARKGRDSFPCFQNMPSTDFFLERTAPERAILRVVSLNLLIEILKMFL